MPPAKKLKSVPADLRKEYGAPFSIISRDEGSRYTNLISRDYTRPRSLDFHLLQTLGCSKTIKGYFRTLSLEKFVKMKHHGYRELMLEFYTTLSFEDDDDGFQCRLMGKSVTVTRRTLCEIFGFRSGGHKTVAKGFDPLGFWREISVESGDFKIERMGIRHIKDLSLLIMYKYISLGLFGRVNSSWVRVKQLFYLWCVYRGVLVCTPSFLIDTFKSVLSNPRLNMCLGNIITAIAVHFGTFDPLSTDMTVLPMLPLEITRTLKKRQCYKEATAETSSSSDQDDGEDTNPVAIDDQPAVDTWMLISRKLEKMQKRMDSGFNAIETRFDGLEKKVNAMRVRFKTFERKCVDSMQQESNGTNAVEELKQENFEAKKSVEKFRMEKSESDKAAAIYKTRLDKLLPSIKKIEEGLSKMSSMKVVDLASLVDDMRELGTFEEGDDLGFPDSRGKTDSLGNGSMPNVNAEDVAVFLPGARVNSNTIGSRSKRLPKNVARASGTPLISGEARFCKTTSSSVAAGDNIIEVLDSEDETNSNRTALTSKRVLDADVGKNDMNFVLSKRNRTDNSLIHEKGNEFLKSTHDNVDCSPSGKCVEEARESQNCLNNRVSADSEDEALSDSGMEDLIASIWREKNVRKFMYEADMLLAFQQDEKLCLDALCALYKQTISSWKSNGHLTLSNNGGFSPIYSMSGCALAEYLIDGDKELRLKKSVSEVKRQRPDVITQCKRLASIYVVKLFEIYCAGDDPLFCRSQSPSC